MQTMMDCLIADDEELAQEGLRKYAEQIPFLNIVGMCGNGFEVTTELQNKKVDLLFLDIEMPRMTGLEFLRNNKSKPLTIITTAYPDYALVGYEYDIVDYLLKPISFDRFCKSAVKAKEIFDLKQQSQVVDVQEKFFFIKSGTCFEKIFYDEILFVRALQNYVEIQTTSKRHTCYLTMKNVEEYLPQGNFIKVNKSYIIAISKIDKISGLDIMISHHTIPIARSNKDQIIRTITEKRLLKRK